MSFFRILVRRFGILLNREAAERDMADEMRFHIEQEQAELIRDGLSPEAARREALKRFGGVDRYKEEGRDARGVRFWEDIGRDVRYAARTLRKSPAFTAVALITLALGVGATTAIFSLVNAVLLRPLPYGEPERIVEITADFGGKTGRNLSPAEYLDLRDRLQVASQMGVYASGILNSTDGEPERLRTVWLSAEVIPAFGVSPALGRNFTREEEIDGAAVVILSDGFWRRRFGARADILGRTIRLNDEAAEVIGVMPPGFSLPEAIISGDDVSLYTPIGIDPAQVTDRGSHFLLAVARLRPGMTFAAGADAVRRLGEWMVEEYPDEYPADMRYTTRATPISQAVVGRVRPALLVLLGAVGFVLLIVCANMANLLLARSDARRRELALRAALGADRARIVRQLLVEAAVLALAGGVLGVVFSYGGIEFLLALRPPNIPRLDEVSVDFQVLGFALIISTLTGITFGLVPALHMSRGHLADSLRQGGRAVAGTRGGERTRRLLVVAEVAVALMLLAGAGLFTRSFLKLYNVDRGFSTGNVLSVRLSPPFQRYQGEKQILAFWSELQDEFSRQPGVIAASVVRNLPLATRQGDMSFEHEGQPVPAEQSKPASDWNVVTPGYFQVMGVPLQRGRVFENGDDADAPGVIVINEEMAHLFWPGVDPLGKRIRLGGEQTKPRWASVIGIVRNVTHNGLDAAPRPQMYFTHRQFRGWDSGSPLYSMSIVLKTEGDPRALTGTVRRSIRDADPQLPIGGFRTMDEVVSAAVSQQRFLMALLLAFSMLAVILAAVGIYGVLAYSVGERTQEFGVRLALGAKTADVAAMVVRGGLALVAVGLAIGLGGALIVTRLVSGLLFEVSPADPVTMIGVSLLLGLVALVACYVPAWRATRVDPVVSLRAE